MPSMTALLVCMKPSLVSAADVVVWFGSRAWMTPEPPVYPMSSVALKVRPAFVAAGRSNSLLLCSNCCAMSKSGTPWCLT